MRVPSLKQPWQLVKFFEEAQATADTYLYNVKRMADAKKNTEDEA